MFIRFFSKGLFLCALLAGCSTIQSPQPDSNARTPSSLDNNGEPIDDSFDKNLESYWGGSSEKEIAANIAVAEVIRSSVQAQQKIREEVAHSDDHDSKQAKKIFGDLPKPAYATRDVHRKTNGCYKAELHVNSQLKNQLNVDIANALKSAESDKRLSAVTIDQDLGVFAGGATYDAVVRLSNGHPGNRPDRLADARGFAVKILQKGTLGETPISAMDAGELNKSTVLDILSINFPTFFMNDPVRYANLNKVALDSALDFKNKTLAKVQEFWSVFVSGDLTTLEKHLTLYVNGSVIYSPLFQEYFSMVPSRLGPEGVIRAVKYSWIPVTCSAATASQFAEESRVQWAPWTKDRTYQFPPRSPRESKSLPDDFLRLHTQERLAKGEFCLDLYFQLYRDSKSTNIEDSTDIWLRTESERQWWLSQVTPKQLQWEWGGNMHDYVPYKTYLDRIATKQLAPAILAGRLTLKRISDQERSVTPGNNKTCEDLSFNPWNGNIAYHKPLGVVSRMKRKVYNASRRERHQLNGIDDKNIERD